MKTLTLFFTFLLSFPFMLSAQSGEELLQKVASALGNKQSELAVALFRQAVKADAAKAEMFYWTEVEKNSETAPKLATELATYYKRNRSYDKAYLFYKELLQNNPDNVNFLVACAELEVCRGHEAEALRTYEKVLLLDADNLAANIFIGNYLYLNAEREKKQMEEDYRKLASPTRMQYARYKDGLSRILSTGYDKARSYLQNVIRQFPSTEAKKTLDKIKLIEKEINK